MRISQSVVIRAQQIGRSGRTCRTKIRVYSERPDRFRCNFQFTVFVLLVLSQRDDNDFGFLQGINMYRIKNNSSVIRPVATGVKKKKTPVNKHCSNCDGEMYILIFFLKKKNILTLPFKFFVMRLFLQYCWTIKMSFNFVIDDEIIRIRCWY